MINNLRNRIGEKARSVVSSFKQPSKDSKFYEKGTLTPQEFVEAGDKLVLVNPMWEWREAVGPKFENKNLPSEKQMLTAEIKSWQRMKDVNYDEYIEMQQIEEDWKQIDYTNREVVDLEDANDKQDTADKAVKEDELVDLEDALEDLDMTEGQPKDQTLKEINKEMRNYRVYITYDTYYLTPRFWISGTDYNGEPLTKDQIFEEIMSEYKDKTVSLEKHPHLNVQMISIHPCRHAEVVRTLVGKAIDNGNDIMVGQYLFIFLKFIGSVMPSLELDYTTEIEI